MSKDYSTISNLVSKNWEELFDSEAKALAYFMRKDGRTNEEIAAVLETFRLDKERIIKNGAVPKDKKRGRRGRPEVDNKVDSSSLDSGTGFVYICFHEQLKIVKIGYSYSVHSRLECHSKNGFKSTDILMIHDSRAFPFEQFILSFIRANWIPTGSDFLTSKFDGWTECWPYDSMPILSFCGLANCILEYVENSFPLEVSHEV